MTTPAIASLAYIELFVLNNLQAAVFYRYLFGLRHVGVMQNDQGMLDRSTIALHLEDVFIKLTSPITASSNIFDYLKLHGEGVKDIAFYVTDLDSAFRLSCAAGARPLVSPRLSSTTGHKIACIGVFGDVIHTLIEPASLNRPSTRTDAHEDQYEHLQIGLRTIDHIALAVNKNELDKWVDFYRRLGFAQEHEEDVITDFSAMRSKVVSCSGGAVRFPIMEPAPGIRTSQIEDFLIYNDGPGVQHIAFESTHIVRSVSLLKRAGIHFLEPPARYYDSLPNRLAVLPDDIDALRAAGILIDRDTFGDLLQIFTRPISSRSTLFLELVERRGSKGFGSGNIKALFEAIEYDRLHRGTA